MRIAAALTLAAIAAAAFFAKTAKADEVNSLVYNNSPDWTVILFDATSMDSSTPGRTVLSTAPSRGVWYGNGSWYGDTPAWSIGNSAAGNYLSLDLSFSADAADWSSYLYDRSHFVSWLFRPTGCSDGCYGLTPQDGVEFTYGDAFNPSFVRTGFVALDMTQRHTFDFLLKNGQVQYRIDGNVVFSGQAYQYGFSDGLLVIGDGSGPTQTGVGSMTVWGNAIDTAPTMAVLVPEPSQWALFAGGLLGLYGLTALRRRRLSPSAAR